LDKPEEVVRFIGAEDTKVSYFPTDLSYPLTFAKDVLGCVVESLQLSDQANEYQRADLIPRRNI
jgi:hypothetical protein